jgi:hypothetical protein
MIRTLVLALMVLAAGAGPVQAGNRGHRPHGGRHFHGHHERFEHRGFHSFVGVGVFAPGPFYRYPYPYPYPYYVYANPYPIYTPPAVVVEQPALVIELAPIQREVIYPTGRYVLHGDGVNYPYQWVWIPAAPPPPIQ